MRSPDDPGLARERTALAWQRTTVAFVAVALLLLVRALDEPWTLFLLAAAPLAAALATDLHRRAAYRARLRGDTSPHRAALRATAVASVACALVAAVSVAIG